MNRQWKTWQVIIMIWITTAVMVPGTIALTTRHWRLQYIEASTSVFESLNNAKVAMTNANRLIEDQRILINDYKDVYAENFRLKREIESLHKSLEMRSSQLAKMQDVAMQLEKEQRELLERIFPVPDAPKDKRKAGPDGKKPKEPSPPLQPPESNAEHHEK